MWLGELITERGVGNGMSVMIFTQIAATFRRRCGAIKVARRARTAGGLPAGGCAWACW